MINCVILGRRDFGDCGHALTDSQEEWYDDMDEKKEDFLKANELLCDDAMPSYRATCTNHGFDWFMRNETNHCRVLRLSGCFCQEERECGVCDVCLSSPLASLAAAASDRDQQRTRNKILSEKIFSMMEKVCFVCGN